MTQIPQSAWRAQPWKNGRGVTHEIWRTPDDGEYDIRISIAEDKESGPFSVFPGYRRWSFLVGPAPIQLNEIALVAPGDHIELPGETAIEATMRGGPTELLNILARVPIVAGFGPTAHPVRFMFDVATRTAELHEPPIARATSGCIWIA